MNSVICSEHHLLCTLQFTGISSAREQTRWCTKIHLFETISKWQFLYRRNIEMKMKNITDDACIVDFCALENITLPFCLLKDYKCKNCFHFSSMIPAEIWAFVRCNVAFRVSDETGISIDENEQQGNKHQEITQSTWIILLTVTVSTFLVAIYCFYWLLRNAKFLPGNICYKSTVTWWWTSVVITQGSWGEKMKRPSWYFFLFTS